MDRARPDRVTGVLSAGDLDLDRQNWRVRRAGREVHMGPTEFRLLEHLMARPGRVFSRAQLLDNVWGLGFVGRDRTGSHSHGARGGLCLRRNFWQKLIALLTAPELCI
jgi:DNA-binding response OmpR family regulator